ncbi:MAG: EAL domain-containing protein [Acidiferrobacter sp.]
MKLADRTDVAVVVRGRKPTAPVVILVLAAVAAAAMQLWHADSAPLTPWNTVPMPLFLRAIHLVQGLLVGALMGVSLLAGLRLWQRRSVTIGHSVPIGGETIDDAPRAGLLRSIKRWADRDDCRPYSTLLVDIDGFKGLNDRHGPEAGDEILQQVAARLKATLPAPALMGRFGSDEFLVFLPDIDHDAALTIAATLRCALADPAFVVGCTAMAVTVSTGVASFPDTSCALPDCISKATSALLEAKAQGQGMIASAGTGKVGICHLGARVEAALADGRMRPAYQPIVELRSGRVVAEEGLARILLPTGAILTADHFMAAATELRLSSRIDGCLIHQTLDRCRGQLLRGDRRLRFMNVSAGLLNERRFLEQLAESFARCAILSGYTGAANPLVVEITERALLRDTKRAMTALQPLLDIGVRLAIDDFGSGYSSFLYLTALPVAFVKIEMTLLQAARTNTRAQAIMRGIRAIATDLNMTTVAEGIEDPELAALARDVGMDWGQGFYYGRPVLASPAGWRARSPMGARASG